jgi:hypothetical protein
MIIRSVSRSFLAHLVAELDDAAADLLVELAQVLVDGGLGADVEDDLGGALGGGLGGELLEADEVGLEGAQRGDGRVAADALGVGEGAVEDGAGLLDLDLADLEGLGEVGLLGGAELVLAAELGGERDVGGDPGRLAVGDGEVLVELDVDGGEEIEAGLQAAQLGDDRQRGAGGGEQDQDHEGGDAGGEAVTQAQRGERDGVGGR